MPRRFRPSSLWIAPALLTLAGCAAQGTFPSLLPRAVERNVTTEEPVREPMPVASDPALRARAAGLLGLARDGQSAFEAALAPAQAAAARAGAPGSDSWVTAQEAISRVEAARTQTARAVAELDALAVARAAEPTNAGDFAAIHDAAEEARRLGEAQQARLERLRASVRSG